MRVAAAAAALAATGSGIVAAANLPQHFSAALAGSLSGRNAASALDCATCKLVVGAAQQVANNTADLQELTDLIQHGACQLISFAPLTELCDKLASVPSDVLAFLNKEMLSVAWDIPLNFCATVVPVCTIPCCETDTVPEQRRLALTNDPTQMSITWTTLNATNSSTVMWGPASGAPALPFMATGSQRTQSFGGWLGSIHMAVMTGLQPGTTYNYKVGDAAGGWSDVANFTTLPSNVGTPGRPLRIVQTGDAGWGRNSDATAAALTQLVRENQVDVCIHIGDVSYSDGNENGWGIFFRKFEPVRAFCPTLDVRGNHEATWQNGAEFYAQLGLSMPNPINATTGSPFTAPLNRTYFSMDLGPQLHLAMFDTESPIDTSDVDDAQLAWLDADLKAAAAARTAGGPAWVIAAAHRPLYCTNDGYGSSNKDCGIMADVLRGQVESVFYNNHVDLVLAAHMHGYEATWPTFGNKAMGTSFNAPVAPVYVVNGAAGNREGNDSPKGNAPWSLPGAVSSAWGYGLITLVGSSTPGQSSLRYDFVSSTNGTVLSTLTITK